jgi:hypothetical protein
VGYSVTVQDCESGSITTRSRICQSKTQHVPDGLIKVFIRIDAGFFTNGAFPDKKGLDSAEFQAGLIKPPGAETITVKKG